MKTVSVILATYNGEKTIEQVVASMLNQEGNGTEFSLELIAVDDCSKDCTVNLLNKFNLQVFSTEQNTGGPNHGRNIGLSKATGNYICIADQDDVWAPNKIKTLLPHLCKVPIVTSGYTVVDHQTNKTLKRTKQSTNGYTYFQPNETFLAKLTRSKTGQNTYLGSIIYSNNLQHIRFEETHGMVDYDWILRLFEGQDSIEVAASLFTRVVHGNNLSLDAGYRQKDYEYSLSFVERYQNGYLEAVQQGKKNIHGSKARYHYVMGEMKQARTYFRLAGLNVKTALYYLTTFGGSSLVKKYFNVFG